MRRFWQWRGEWMRPSREPRPGAPEAPPDFVQRLAADVREQRGRSMSRPAGFALRLALAATITLVMVATFAGFGSLGYAANSLKGTAKAAKGKIWNGQAGAHATVNDDDDDGGGGGGGGGDDDDDGGGGGGGGGDDDDDDGGDDDDGDDDEYEEEEEECRDAIQTQRRAFHDQQHAAHRAFHRNPTGSHKAFHDQQQAQRRAFNIAIREALDDCDEIGGGGDDDDDDD
jgi:hypothetical protein